MPRSTQAIARDALSLPSEERAKLAHDLIVSLDTEGIEAESDIEDAWDREIGRRVAEIREGRAHGRPAEQLLAEIRAKA